VTDNLVEEGAPDIKRDTLLLIDPSDISKKYAKKMEYLAHVRDGSEKELSKGYWTVRVVGAELERVKIIPLYEHLYSQNAPEFESENTEILKAVDCVRKEVEDRGIWVMDRGGDHAFGVVSPLSRARDAFHHPSRRPSRPYLSR